MALRMMFTIVIIAVIASVSNSQFIVEDTVWNDETDQLTFEEAEDDLHVKWIQARIDPCNIHYKVDVFINTILVNTRRTSGSSYIVNNVKPCMKIHVHVQEVAYGIPGDVMKGVYIPDVGSVTDVVVEDNVASWTVPDDFLHCSYEVKVNETVYWVNQQVKEFNLTGLGLEPCKEHALTVTPVGYSLKKGVPVLKIFETEIGKVNGFQISSQTENLFPLTATWENTYPNCQYRITQNDKVVCETSASTSCEIEQFSEVLEPCTTYEFSLHAVSSLKIGEGANAFANVPLQDEVKSFTVVSENDASVAKWETVGEKCLYSVSVDDFLENVGSATEFKMPTSVLRNCTYSYVFLNILAENGEKTNDVSYYYRPEMKITDLSFQRDNSGVLHTIWSDLGDDCEYSVKINNKLIISETREHDLVLDEHQKMNYCTVNNISIQPLSTFSNGEEIQKGYPMDPINNFNAIENVRAVVVENALAITWDLDETLKSCELTYKILCSVNKEDPKLDLNIQDVQPYLTSKCKIDNWTSTLDVTIQAVENSVLSKAVHCEFEVDYGLATVSWKGCNDSVLK